MTVRYFIAYNILWGFEYFRHTFVLSFSSFLTYLHPFSITIIPSLISFLISLNTHLSVRFSFALFCLPFSLPHLSFLPLLLLHHLLIHPLLILLHHLLFLSSFSPLLPVVLPATMDDPRQRRPDITTAKQQLDWEPRVPVRDGLAKAIEYFSKVTDRATDHSATRSTTAAFVICHDGFYVIIFLYYSHIRLSNLMLLCHLTPPQVHSISSLIFFS